MGKVAAGGDPGAVGVAAQGSWKDPTSRPAGSCEGLADDLRAIHCQVQRVQHPGVVQPGRRPAARAVRSVIRQHGHIPQAIRDERRRAGHSCQRREVGGRQMESQFGGARAERCQQGGLSGLSFEYEPVQVDPVPVWLSGRRVARVRAEHDPVARNRVLDDEGAGGDVGALKEGVPRPLGTRNRAQPVFRHHEEAGAQLQIGSVDAVESQEQLAPRDPANVLEPVQSSGAQSLRGGILQRLQREDDVIRGQRLAVAPAKSGGELDVDCHGAAVRRRVDVPVALGGDLPRQVRVGPQLVVETPKRREDQSAQAQLQVREAGKRVQGHRVLEIGRGQGAAAHGRRFGLVGVRARVRTCGAQRAAGQTEDQGGGEGGDSHGG